MLIVHVENNASSEASASCHLCERDSIAIVCSANRDTKRLERCKSSDLHQQIGICSHTVEARPKEPSGIHIIK